MVLMEMGPCLCRSESAGAQAPWQALAGLNLHSGTQAHAEHPERLDGLEPAPDLETLVKPEGTHVPWASPAVSPALSLLPRNIQM